jgi:hemerythrin superfamily protein
MLQEHVEIVRALNELERVAAKAKKRNVVEFAKKLKLHAETEEDLTYPAVLMAGKLLRS